MKIITADFVTSAAAGGRTEGIPADGLGQIAMAGRSNVGKSTLLNVLVRQKIARTSAAPGKTRLANIYRVAVDGGPGGPGRWGLYFVDLPGYGYARGGDDAARELAEVARAYFETRDSRFAVRGPNDPADSANRDPSGLSGSSRARSRDESRAANGDEARRPHATLLLVDARHPGLDLDIQAHRWLTTVAGPPQIIATKVDKLSRSERTRNLKELERVFGTPPLPTSATGGEGLDELWKLIARVARPTAPK